jgi:hypothetical protein
MTTYRAAYWTPADWTGDVRLTAESEAGLSDGALMCLALFQIEAIGIERHDGDSIIIGEYAE